MQIKSTGSTQTISPPINVLHSCQQQKCHPMPELTTLVVHGRAQEQGCISEFVQRHKALLAQHKLS